jgi:hypothetical protein
MAVLSALKIDILSNFGDSYISIGEVVFKTPAGDVLPNTGINVSAAGELLPDYAAINTLNLRNSSYAKQDFWAHQASASWIAFSFPENFDVGSIEIYNRWDNAYGQSPKDILITAFDANFENAADITATRPSDAAGAVTTHDIGTAWLPITKYTTNTTLARLAPGANFGAPVPKANVIPIARQNTVDGGTNKLTGIVTVSSQPASRRVRLLDQQSWNTLGETWSDPITGVYKFDYIRPGTFMVIALDYTGAFDPEAKADLHSEPMA